MASSGNFLLVFALATLIFVVAAWDVGTRITLGEFGVIVCWLLSSVVCLHLKLICFVVCVN